MISKIVRLSKALSKESLRRLPYVLAVLLIVGLFGIYQSYRKTSEAVRIARDNTSDIKNILTSQTGLLLAINQVAIDNKLTSDQKTNTIICMLQVEVEKRTQDVLSDCREKSIQVGQTGGTSAPTPKVQAP